MSRVQQAVAFITVYSMVLGLCYQAVYWAQFGVNPIEYLSFSDLAKMSIISLAAGSLAIVSGVIICELLPLSFLKVSIISKLSKRLPGDCVLYDVLKVVCIFLLSYLKKGSLLITPGDREDLLLAALSLALLSSENRLAGILLTGGILPRENVANLLKKSNIPVYHVLHDTYETAKKVSNLNVKITINDKKKIETAKTLIDEFVDKDYILENI